MAQSSSQKHFICPFSGCDNRCDGNHSGPCDGLSICPTHVEVCIYDIGTRRPQCENCIHPRDDRFVRYTCRKCPHHFCYACCFK